MKRLLTFSLFLLLTLATTQLVVAQQGVGPRGNPLGAGLNFVDANGDGICDHIQAGGRGAGRMGAAGVCAWCGGFGANGASLVDIAATTLGRDRVDVVAELRTGKTLAQVMEANGRTSHDLVDAVVANRKAALDHAVTTHTLSAQQADEMLGRIKTHVERTVSATWQPRGRHFGGNCPRGGSQGRRQGGW
jgi:hypothetical protein